ncbi:MAG: DUF5683 domain-containing protein [Bacteroidales bacterium]|nr:DUF5683 domain-containing protein [Bacteroidales bacterium]
MWKNYIKTYILTIAFAVLHSNLFAQIEDFPDTLRIDSSHQELKMIVQEKDSTVLIPVDSLTNTSIAQKEWDPHKSWWMSAILPGLGQAHNKKYWKIPIIYTIFAASIYMIEDNNFKYKIYKNAYAVFATDGAPSWSPQITEKLLKDRKDFYRRNRDLSIILGSVFYLMNILDASVDANLMDFDISDDLSLRVEPQIKQVEINAKNSFGLKFVLSLNN